MGKLPISATIVVRNGEDKIGGCLDSMAGIVGEIILVHDGKCRDRTLEIAKKYTKSIYVRKYIGEAEPHRKFSFFKAKHNWILQVDADEYLTPKLRDNLKELINEKETAGFMFKWNQWYVSTPPRYALKLALFRKDRIKEFYGIPHETVSLKGNVLKRWDLELGHNKTLSKGDYAHKNFVWPKVHGMYMERYKYLKVPLPLLYLGYFFYPFGNTVAGLMLGQLRVPIDIIRNFRYHFRVWKTFLLARRKRLRRKDYFGP